MSEHELPAAAIAEYDQALKQSEQFLASLVASYRWNRAKDMKVGYPEAVSVVACSMFLADDLSHQEVASALAVAILAFARDGERDGGS